ncbi:protein sisterless A-like [Musca autumnalis]|uniref:protein sisterless A-like n=1 Tax=Musca autumnalis TaxID=221902 RepID=UPI003CEBCA20
MHQHKHQHQEEQQHQQRQHDEHNSHHGSRANTPLTSPSPTTEGILLQQAFMSLAQNLQMQSISNFQHLGGISYIEQVVEIEMQRLKANCKREEDHYVEQMLLENPIVVERRSSVAASEQSTKTATDATPKTNDDNNGQQHTNGNGCNSISSNNGVRNDLTLTLMQQQQQQQREQQQQRAESCRRSRINNKIKKAKMKFRHKFMSTKLVQSLRMLECIQKLIDQTELQLMSQGFSGQQLEKLKELIFCNASL